MISPNKIIPNVKMDMSDRDHLKLVYEHMTKEEKRQLANHLGKRTSTLRRYCKNPYSDRVPKTVQQRLLNFWPKSVWDEKYALALALTQTQTQTIQKTVFRISFDKTDFLPDVIIFNDVEYSKL